MCSFVPRRSFRALVPQWDTRVKFSRSVPITASYSDSECAPLFAIVPALLQNEMHTRIPTTAKPSQTRTSLHEVELANLVRRTLCFN